MKVLFICKSNQFRSQMAAALYNLMTGTSDAVSAGTFAGSKEEPEGTVIETRFQSPDFFELMEEHGMYIRKNRTRKLLPEMIDASDLVISMVEEPFIPDFLRANEKVEWWNVENPTLATREVSANTFKQIHELVRALVQSSS